MQACTALTESNDPQVPLYALGMDCIENTASDSSIVPSLPACPFPSNCSGTVVAYGLLPTDG
jgi:hypothetical protein